jgi:hypothetical protein
MIIRSILDEHETKQIVGLTEELVETILQALTKGFMPTREPRMATEPSGLANGRL